MMKCKDCRYFDTEDGKEGYCQEFIYPVNDRCFCNIDAEPPEKPKPDLVEVVRCKDCVWYDERRPYANGNTLYECRNIERFLPPDFFCKDGERRTNELQH